MAEKGQADGRPAQVNRLLDWAGGQLLLLWFGPLSGGAGRRLRELALHAPVRLVQVLPAREHAQAVEHVRDPQGHLRQACHVTTGPGAWALVRPDGYLAATGAAVDGRLVKAVATALMLEGKTA